MKRGKRFLTSCEAVLNFQWESDDPVECGYGTTDEGVHSMFKQLTVHYLDRTKKSAFVDMVRNPPDDRGILLGVPPVQTVQHEVSAFSQQSLWELVESLPLKRGYTHLVKMVQVVWR